jgi:DNA-binding NarL/FixJ family response regulator
MLSLSHIKITPRDEQVLQLLIRACGNKEIAAQLKISPRTVKQPSADPVSEGWNPRR